MDALMKLTARVNGPPRLTGEALLVICSYRGGNNNAEPRAFSTPVLWRIFNFVTFLNLRRFIAAMRDHFANPRDTAYQIAMADALIETSSFSAVSIIKDARLAVPADRQETPAGREIQSRVIDRNFFSGIGKLDTVVLIYPDPLGLTWSDLEKSARSVTSNLIIVNGRRRMFTWDRAIAKSLAARRFLANTRLVELAWGVLVVPFAAVLAAADFVRGRT